MINIRTDRPFVLFAESTVKYSGRAESIIDKGNYLFIHKFDGSFSIHAGIKLTPINYQSAGTQLEYVNHILTVKRKNELITADIHTLHHYYEPENWSYNKRVTSKTESDLRNKIVQNITKILNLQETEIWNVFIEYKTPFGPIDIVVHDVYGVYHIIEVKRGTASLNACTQIMRYSEHFVDRKYEHKMYIISPNIGKNALKFAKSHNINWISVDHNYEALGDPIPTHVGSVV